MILEILAWLYVIGTVYAAFVSFVYVIYKLSDSTWDIDFFDVVGMTCVGFLTAFLMSFIWPLCVLGYIIILIVERIRYGSKN